MREVVVIVASWNVEPITEVHEEDAEILIGRESPGGGVRTLYYADVV